MARRSEFTVENAYAYNTRSVGRWIASHIGRYPIFALIAIAGFLTAWFVYARAQVLIGVAINEILTPTSANGLLLLALSILGLLVVDGLSILSGYFAAENVAARFEADARQELYESLLGKSKTFHDRQRVGDIMARATDDTNQLSNMIVPGGSLVLEVFMGFIVPLSFIISVKPELVFVPLLYTLSFIVIVRRYLRRLNPIMTEQREAYGKMNASLEETVSGIEVVKASARELFERAKFHRSARRYRDLFVAQGNTEARYLPLLVYGFVLGLTFLHALWLYQLGQISIGEIVSVMGLVNILRFPTFISLFAFSVFEAGVASARRILQIIKADSDMDENDGGYSAPINGEIVFAGVSFGYEPTDDGRPQTEDHQEATAVHRPSSTVLNNISLQIKPGQTVAIVGQTGSGKSALTQLINRTYDASSGQVLIDGVDVREWRLDALRSQISKIEQDIFLFSRSIADNIAFGRPSATRQEVEDAARAAQAHEFISGFPEGYDTVVGERGMTLSGGQRQRIALARAFLSDPRILILDDSTSAIDSATEDQIQQAINQMQAGRTTLLITHRISQIRWADLIVLLDRGAVMACGTHDELLRSSPHYRRIFARYDVELPPLENVDLRLQIAE